MKEMQQVIREIIENGRDFLVMGHKSVDGDAYGSSMGLYLYLQSRGKNVEIINELPITPLFHFLDIHNHVRKEIIGKKFDAIFVCDCGELSLIGKYPERYADIFGNAPIINIDHHNGNKLFGACNLVDTGSSSTCEILYDLLESMDHAIDPQVATLLLFGVIRDTNCFKNSIRPHTFEVTSKLIALEADYENIIFHSYKSEKLNYLKLYSHVLENLISLKWGTILGGIITQDVFKKYGIWEDELGPQLINEILSSIEGASFAFLIKETETVEKKLSFRARLHGIDVSRIARQFGGGWHIQSAWGRSEKTTEEILKIIEEVDVRIIP